MQGTMAWCVQEQLLQYFIKPAITFPTAETPQALLLLLESLLLLKLHQIVLEVDTDQLWQHFQELVRPHAAHIDTGPARGAYRCRCFHQRLLQIVQMRVLMCCACI